MPAAEFIAAGILALIGAGFDLDQTSVTSQSENAKNLNWDSGLICVVWTVGENECNSIREVR